MASNSNMKIIVLFLFIATSFGTSFGLQCVSMVQNEYESGSTSSSFGEKRLEECTMGCFNHTCEFETGPLINKMTYGCADNCLAAIKDCAQQKGEFAECKFCSATDGCNKPETAKWLLDPDVKPPKHQMKGGILETFAPGRPGITFTELEQKLLAFMQDDADFFVPQSVTKIWAMNRGINSTMFAVEDILAADRNRDGMLSAREMVKWRILIWKHFDTNGDGYLTEEEEKEAMQELKG